jgi:hypothetical protein
MSYVLEVHAILGDAMRPLAMIRARGMVAWFPRRKAFAFAGRLATLVACGAVGLRIRVSHPCNTIVARRCIAADARLILFPRCW